MTERDPMKDLEDARARRGVCRHCGRALPCWSPYGDYARGQRHTKATMAAMRAANRAGLRKKEVKP